MRVHLLLSYKTGNIIVSFSGRIPHSRVDYAIAAITVEPLYCGHLGGPSKCPV